MSYYIKYNDIDDEFMLDLSLEMRLDRYIKNHFYPAKAISTLSPIYLIGGGIRDLMNAKIPKDLDFVVLGEDEKWIQEVFKAFKIEPGRNRFDGFKFEYNDTIIDLWLTKDLFSAMQYNVDGILYDVKNKRMISLTYNDFLKNGLREINPENNIDNGRVKKLLKFEKEHKIND